MVDHLMNSVKAVTYILSALTLVAVVDFPAIGSTADSLVSIPEFRYEEIKKHKAADDEEVVYSSRPTRTLQLRRAQNLLAAGHYEEAINEYAKGADEWKVPMQFRTAIDQEWGLACEKVGRYDEAIGHYKSAGAQEALAKLLLELNRYAEVKSIADAQILDCLVLERKYHGYDENFPEWLRVRAVAEAGLADDKSAVRDLEEAAKKYFKNDLKKAELCIREANLLITRSKLGDALTLDTQQLPQTGKEHVIALIQFIVSSPEPFKLSRLNELTGGHLKVPGRTWPNYCEDEKPGIPFTRLQYHSEHDNYRIPEILEIDISTDKCCIPKREIDALVPLSVKKVRPISHWNESDETRFAEAFEIPTGNLKFYFGESGARILRKVTLKAPAPAKAETAEIYWKEARALSDDESSKKIALLSKSIALDDQIVEVFVERAHSFARMKRFQEALDDAKHAVSLGGRAYLNEQSIIEEEMGSIDAAIEHVRAFIGSHKPGPETAPYFTRLAELYCKRNQYASAFEASEKAIVDSRNTTRAMFIRAKAEAGLGRISEARRDGNVAAKQYFDQARIVLRDEVLDWLTTLPEK